MRKSILSLIFSALLATMGFTTSSNAIGLEGLGIGFSIGTAGYYAVGEETEDNNPVGVDDTKQAGAFKHDLGSLFVEYTTGPVTFGIDYHLSDIETPTNTNIQGSLTNTVKASFENHITGYITVPVFHALYVKAGVIHVDINTQENLATGGEYGNTDTTGITAGLGLSREIQNGVSIRAEALFAQYDDVKATNSKNTTTSVSITDMMGASARISIVKTF
jgi:opacity protein-like surface antigen